MVPAGPSTYFQLKARVEPWRFEIWILDDRFHESCHKQGIHLRFWIPTYAACAHKERMESHGSVAAGD